MFQPGCDTGEMALVIIARPPCDLRRVRCEMHHVLAGAATGLQHIAGFAGEECLQHRPDRPMVAVERRRVQPPIGLDRPAILAEFDYKFRHRTLLTSALDRGAPVAKARNFSVTPRPSGYSAGTLSPRCNLGSGRTKVGSLSDAFS